jgi:hypothetical protein
MLSRVWIVNSDSDSDREFLIPFYLQAVQILSANGAKLLEA